MLPSVSSACALSAGGGINTFPNRALRFWLPSRDRFLSATEKFSPGMERTIEETWRQGERLSPREAGRKEPRTGEGKVDQNFSSGKKGRRAAMVRMPEPEKSWKVGRNEPEPTTTIS